VEIWKAESRNGVKETAKTEAEIGKTEINSYFLLSPFLYL
jgi:hypothetical protein